MEWENCMSPPLFPHSMLEGFWTTFKLDGFLSFRAFWTAMPPPLFLTSTPADKRLPLTAGALMVQAGPRGKEAMFTMSKAQLLRKASRSEAAKRAWVTKRARKCVAGGLWLVYTRYIPGIYCNICVLSKFWSLLDSDVVPTLVHLSWCVHIHLVLGWSQFSSSSGTLGHYDITCDIT